MKATEFNLQTFADATVAEILDIQARAVGQHVNRALGALSGRVEKQLKRLGFSDEAISRLWRDCRDMAELQSISEE